MNVTLLLFLIVVGITLGITAWAARRSGTTVQTASCTRSAGWSPT